MGKKGSKFKLSKDELDDIRGRFTDEEMEHWYSEFKRHCKKSKSGEEYLSEKDFLLVYASVFPGDASDYVRHIFRSFDLDGNGRVNFREFLVGLHMSESSDVEGGLRWAFKVFDISENGTISKAEMTDIVKSVYKMLNQSTVRLTEEFSTPEKVVDRVFAKMDSDHDANLTWEEFRDGVMDDPSLLNLLQCNPPQAE